MKPTEQTSKRSNNAPGGPASGKRSGKITIREIAHAAGVSVNTVSLALRHSPRVQPLTHARILALAKEKGYRPNLLARAVITGESRLIGVLVPRHDFSYLPGLMEAMQNEAVTAGYGLLTLSCAKDASARGVARCLEYFLERCVEGMIILPPAPPLPVEVWDPLLKVATVWLGVGGSPKLGTDMALRPEAAGRIAVEHLAHAGHRQLGFAGPSDDYFSRHRLAAIRRAASHYRLPAPEVWSVPDSVEGGRDAARSWLEAPPRKRPDAAIGFTDAVAVGFLHTLLLAGERIPQTVAVVGADDTPLASAAAIPLSTVRAPVEMIGSQAVREILGQNSGEDSLRSNGTVPAWKWLERQSTRPLATGKNSPKAESQK